MRKVSSPKIGRPSKIKTCAQLTSELEPIVCRAIDNISVEQIRATVEQIINFQKGIKVRSSGEKVEEALRG